MLEEGQGIDRYVVEAEIGVGGMAVVYKVRHRTLGTAHALKVLTLRDATLKERLVQEGRIQARLRHPNVVQVTDVLDVRGAPGLLMEFIEGPSLYTYAYGRALPLAEAEELFRGVLDAIAYAHGSNPPLVHRDLKPANVLLEPRGDRLIPKVTDFGIAKVVADADDRMRTRSRSAMGTPSYMAPEQISDASKVDRRADIFSLGCILYELVTGHMAFDGHDLIAILSAVAKGEYIPPRKHVPDLPDHLERAIRGALVSDRDLRIADCATFRAVLDGERVTWSATMIPVGSPLPGNAAAPRPTSGAPASSATFAEPEAASSTLAAPATLAVPAAPVTLGSPAPAPAPTAAARRSGPGLGVIALGLGGLGMVGIGLLGFTLLFLGTPGSGGGPDGTTDAAPEVTTTPERIAPLEPAPAETTPVAPVTPAPVSPSPVKTEPAKTEPVKTEPAKTEPAKTEPTEPPKTDTVKIEPVAPEPVGTGTIVIGANPSSKLEIDGKTVGETPYRGSVSAGRHTVRLSQGGEAKSTAVTITADETSRFCWDFSINGPCP